MSKNLVAYFSASGVTGKVAEALSGLVDADLYEIKPAQLYSQADLNWMDNQSRSSVEMREKNSRPEISGELPNLDEYENIFIGFPVWWYTAPHIINTFLESCNIAGKNIYVFATSGGSTVEKSFRDLKAAYPAANWKAGKLIRGRITRDMLKGWFE